MSSCRPICDILGNHYSMASTPASLRCSLRKPRHQNGLTRMPGFVAVALGDYPTTTTVQQHIELVFRPASIGIRLRPSWLNIDTPTSITKKCQPPFKRISLLRRFLLRLLPDRFLLRHRLPFQRNVFTASKLATVASFLKNRRACRTSSTCFDRLSRSGRVVFHCMISGPSSHIVTVSVCFDCTRPG